jgi:hypothetical protein
MGNSGYILRGDGIFESIPSKRKKILKKNKNRLKMIKQSKKQNRKSC